MSRDSDNDAERRARADRLIERAERRKQERRKAERRAPPDRAVPRKSKKK
jgi:hypothetical protein